LITSFARKLIFSKLQNARHRATFKLQHRSRSKGTRKNAKIEREWKLETEEMEISQKEKEKGPNGR
jgi:hypothetical protein